MIIIDKSHWSWKKFLTIFNRMVAGKNSFACDIPFECSIDHKLLTQEKIDDDREEIGEVRYLMEYCGLWYGENEKSYFKSDELNNCRVLQKAFYPLKEYDLKNPRALEKHGKQMPKLKGEIRIMGCDIALEEGAKNDNSIYVLMRMIPSGGTYHREVVYMESHNGLDAQKQAIRIKQLFFEFKCDKMIIDINGNGSAVLTNLQQSQYDSKRDTHYEKFDLFNKPRDVDMDLGHNGLQVMYGMRAYERENNDCMVFLKNAIINGKLRLLLDDLEKKNDMASDKRFHTDGEYASDMLKPFIEITKMIHEMINLEYEVKDKGNIGIVNGSGRKDRYSAIAYCNYLAEIIEKDEIKKQSKNDFEFMFFD